MHTDKIRTHGNGLKKLRLQADGLYVHRLVEAKGNVPGGSTC